MQSRLTTKRIDSVGTCQPENNLYRIIKLQRERLNLRGRMESDENEGHSKQAAAMRSEKNAAVDYDEDRVRLELVDCVSCIFSIYESPLLLTAEDRTASID